MRNTKLLQWRHFLKARKESCSCIIKKVGISFKNVLVQIREILGRASDKAQEWSGGSRLHVPERDCWVTGRLDFNGGSCLFSKGSIPVYNTNCTYNRAELGNFGVTKGRNFSTVLVLLLALTNENGLDRWGWARENVCDRDFPILKKLK